MHSIIYLLHSRAAAAASTAERAAAENTVINKSLRVEVPTYLSVFAQLLHILVMCVGTYLLTYLGMAYTVFTLCACDTK